MMIEQRGKYIIERKRKSRRKPLGKESFTVRPVCISAQ
jgi:hypothetical protein